MIEDASKDKKIFLMLMKFLKQSPTVYEDTSEYEGIFKNAKSVLSKYGYTLKYEKIEMIIKRD